MAPGQAGGANDATLRIDRHERTALNVSKVCLRELSDRSFSVHWEWRERRESHDLLVPQRRILVEVAPVNRRDRLLEGRSEIIDVCHNFPFLVGCLLQPDAHAEPIPCRLLSRFFRARRSKQKGPAALRRWPLRAAVALLCALPPPLTPYSVEGILPLLSGSQERKNPLSPVTPGYCQIGKGCGKLHRYGHPTFPISRLPLSA